MFVLPKRNILLPWAGGTIRLARGVMATIPDKAAEAEYFRALVADGKIVPTGKHDKDTQAAAEKPVKVRRGRETSGEG